MRSIERWHFQWPRRTPNRFWSSRHFEVEYLKYRAFYGQSFYRTLIGNHAHSIEWYHFQSPWVTSDPDLQGHYFFWSRISEKRRVLKTKLLLHKRKLCLTYGMLLFGDLDWPLNASHGFVSISWASCWLWLCWLMRLSVRVLFIVLVYCITFWFVCPHSFVFPWAVEPSPLQFLALA